MVETFKKHIKAFGFYGFIKDIKGMKYLNDKK